MNRQAGFAHILTVLVGFGLISLLLIPKSQAQTSTVVTPTLVGTAIQRYAYGQNVWDMKAFGNKVFIAQGDTINNAGPIDINYIDTTTNTLKKDTTSGTWCGTTCFDEEQI